MIEEPNINDELHSSELRDAALFAAQLMQLRKLLTDIKAESMKLQEFFLTEDEIKEKNEAIDFFDARMQSLVYYTLDNLKRYQQSGWKELIYEGDLSNESNSAQ